MRTFRRILLGVVVLVVALVVAAYWYAAAAAAHRHRVRRAQRLRRDPSPAATTPRTTCRTTRWCPTCGAGRSVDRPVRASLLGLLARQLAWYTPGFGCTLSGERPDLGRPRPVGPRAQPVRRRTRPTPAEGGRGCGGRGVRRRAVRRGESALGTRGRRRREGRRAGRREVRRRLRAGHPAARLVDVEERHQPAGRPARRAGQVVAATTTTCVPSGTDERADITVEQLLRMTSGLEWDETYDLGTPITRMLYVEPDMGAYVGEPARRPRARHLPAVLQRQHHAALLDPRRAHRPRRRPAAPGALRAARPVLGGPRAGRRRHAGLQLATSGRRPATGRRSASSRCRTAMWHGEQLLPQGLDGRLHDRRRRRDRGPGLRLRLVGERAARRLARRAVTSRGRLLRQGHDGQRIIVVPSEELVVVRLGFSPRLEDVGAVELAAELIELRSGERSVGLGAEEQRQEVRRRLGQVELGRAGRGPRRRSAGPRRRTMSSSVTSTRAGPDLPVVPQIGASPCGTGCGGRRTRG